MRKSKSYKILVDLVLLAVFCCVVPRPNVNAPNLTRADHAFIGIGEAAGEPGGDYLAAASPLARNLFVTATELDRGLHQHSLETRTRSDYLRVIDAYAMVDRVRTDDALSAESLARAASIMREIADTMGDYGLYRKAIQTFRRIIDEHPRSNYVGPSLIGIAEIYEENLQDLKGAAEAYQALIGYFPESVMAREARAILTRFEQELRERDNSADVTMPAPAAQESGNDYASGLRLENVRNYTGPDYARVVLDLSDNATYQHHDGPKNQAEISISGASISPSLYGRRFIIRDSRFLKQISVSSSGQGGDKSEGVRIQLTASANVDFSAFQLSNPDRVVIDLRTAEDKPAAQAPAQAVLASRNSPASGTTATSRSAVAAGHAPVPVSARAPSIGDRRLQEQSLGLATASLPDVDVSNLSALQESMKTAIQKEDPHSEGGAVTDPVKPAVEPSGAVKCIVIDPGHGGHDTGTIGEGGLKEKDLVLAVGLRLRDYVKKNFPYVEVVMTRDSDRFVALEERTAIANSKRADLFISVHANAAPSHVASGVETYFLSPDRASSEDLRAAQRENAAPVAGQQPVQADQHSKTAASGDEADAEPAAQSEDKLRSVVASVSAGNRITQSRELASYIQSGLVHGVGSLSPRTAANRGVKHAPFIVLLGASMPSVLAEISFVSNPHDENLLTTDAFRDRIAVSLFAGLRAYLKKREAPPASNSKKK